MTIDKAIAKIWHCIVSIRDCTGNKEFVEALELSIDTMRKFQKIEEIRHRVKYTDLEPAKAYELINEVMEDGKID